MPSSTAASTVTNPPHLTRSRSARSLSAASGVSKCADAETDWRLHKHADYQRVYQGSRKQFSGLMSYFAATQPAERAGVGPRVGITAGKVLGKAVDRNRIKRRMRAAIVTNLEVLDAHVDVVLHPKRSVLDAEWLTLRDEVRRIFLKIQASGDATLRGASPAKARGPRA